MKVSNRTMRLELRALVILSESGCHYENETGVPVAIKLYL